MKEQWKDLSGVDARLVGYSTSNTGRIRSNERLVKHWRGTLKKWRGKILKQQRLNSGYVVVSLGKKRGTFLVHRLVAKGFIDNPHHLPCVNHLDGNKRNNNAKNLAWCTYSENEKYSYAHLGKRPNKSNIGNTGILSASAKPVARYSPDGTKMTIWGSASEAARSLGTSQGRISFTCRTGIKHKNQLFKYIPREEFKELMVQTLF